MQIIPAIDLIDGKCVRLTQGDYAQKTVYSENPLDVAMAFEDHGLQRLHLVDLDGAKAGRIVQYKVLETIATKTRLVIDFGGGIKTEEDLQCVYNSGARIATLGSLAVKDPVLFFLWVNKYGSDKLFLGADVKHEKIAVGGWLENTSISVFDFIEQNLSQGVSRIFCTDISKDGKMEGPSLALYQQLMNKNPGLELFASGGISSLQDLEDLKKIKCSGAIVGKAIYEGYISLKDLALFNNN